MKTTDLSHDLLSYATRGATEQDFYNICQVGAVMASETTFKSYKGIWRSPSVAGGLSLVWLPVLYRKLFKFTLVVQLSVYFPFFSWMRSRSQAFENSINIGAV